jgi:transcriptional/translational regulatory protein YebC/TACO1
MKILLIHSDGVEVIKQKLATSEPQKFPEKKIKMDGLVLVAYVSVEDQDTYDTDIIAKQGTDVIEDAILLITGFPEKIREKNEEIRKHNKKIESGEIKGKPRNLVELIKERDFFKLKFLFLLIYSLSEDKLYLI